jgi:hypothetical protein
MGRVPYHPYRVAGDRFLRMQRWLPHKERLNSTGSGHPTAVRFHRACSWLEEAERFHTEDQTDHALIFRWTAFNALYGQWDLDRHEPLADRQSWQVFLSRMLATGAWSSRFWGIRT